MLRSVFQIWILVDTFFYRPVAVIFTLGLGELNVLTFPVAWVTVAGVGQMMHKLLTNNCLGICGSESHLGR